MKALLSALGIVDSNPSTVVRFETLEVQPHLPYHVAFLVDVECLNDMIKCTVIDEGAATSVMSLACWKGLGSPVLQKSMTMLNEFDGCSFQLHGIILSLQDHLGGKIVAVEVEVVDVPQNYNLLLGQNWIYTMKAIISSVFQVM